MRMGYEYEKQYGSGECRARVLVREECVVTKRLGGERDVLWRGMTYFTSY